MKETIIVPSPDSYLRKSKDTEKQHAEIMFDYMLKAIKKNHNETCAVIVEPLVQCAGYMRMYHPVYLKLLRQACDKYNIHLIADEIAVGFGRTGTMFAYEQSKITPDIVCLSKGITGGYMTLSTILTTDDLYDAFYDEYTKLNAFLHSHSHTINSNCMRSSKCIYNNLFEKNNVIDKNKALSKYIFNSLKNLINHPHFSDVRQHGMITAVEIVKE